MATVEIEPADAASAAKPVPLKVDEVVDQLGRTLRVRKLNALGKVDLADLVGASRGQNEGVMAPALIAFSVCAIDGKPVLPPSNYKELRALIGQLDDEGLEAAAGVMIKNGWVAVQPETPEDIEAAGDGLKN